MGNHLYHIGTCCQAADVQHTIGQFLGGEHRSAQLVYEADLSYGAVGDMAK